MNLRLEGGGDSFAIYMPNPLISKQSRTGCLVAVFLGSCLMGCEGKQLFAVKKVLLISSKESLYILFTGK